MPERAALLLATRSADKLREIRDILAPITTARIISLAEAGVAETPDEEHIEAFDSFLANAHAKAAWFLRLTALPTLADDSGISVAALHGAPGVRSKRFAPAAAGLHGAALDDANNRYLLERLRDVADDARTAHYTCAAVLHAPDGRRSAAVGVRSGRILTEPRGRHGFGFDPLFFDSAAQQSFGELDPLLKNRTSHRARAFRALAALL